ncbi:hypothetical protein Nepgr_007121 [Nepenthes gracilis]|uniref:Uncharacterized protein n=1 Tax=Nepenthes gracilis TaxID=150966 RepID=A0AAD3XI82_NEPGR|nr:hypothetical protein Nepgr_007121 [Nepenthes gracilis]
MVSAMDEPVGWRRVLAAPGHPKATTTCRHEAASKHHIEINKSQLPRKALMSQGPNYTLLRSLMEPAKRDNKPTSNQLAGAESLPKLPWEECFPYGV